MDETVKTAFAEGRIVAWKADDCLGFTFSAIHAKAGLG
jgi:hypothetical protein